MIDEDKKKAEEALPVDDIVAVAREAIRVELEPLQASVMMIKDIVANASRAAKHLEFQDTAIRMAMLFVRSPHRKGALRRLGETAFPEHVKDAIRASFSGDVTVSEAITKLETYEDGWIRATAALFRRDWEAF